jgi:hypothetical protein
MKIQGDGQPTAVANDRRRQMAAVSLRFDREVELQPAAMLSLLPALVSTRVSLEMVGHRGEVTMVVAAAGWDGERLRGLLESALPGSRVVEAVLPMVSAPFLGWELETRLVDSLPLQANPDPKFDLLAALANLLAEDQEACAIFQVVLQPVRAEAWRHRAARDAHRLTVAEPSLSDRLVGLVLGGSDHKAPPPTPRWVRSLQEAAYEKSASQVLVKATVRFAAQATGRDATARIVKQALGLACASFTGGANTLQPIRLGSQETFARALNERLAGREITATPEEVAVLWHPPTRPARGVPGLWVSGRRVRSPRSARQGDLCIGRDVQGHEIFLRQPDRLTHAALLGATGSGKTTLMLNLALADAESGDGFALLDPKGPAVMDLLSRLPASRSHDVILLDPAAEDGISFNPLDRG